MWKKYIYIPIILMGMALLSSCEKEDPIESKFEVKFGSFDFPQGTNSWDTEIQKIYEEYGVKVIYKDITESDLTRNWVGGWGSSVAPTVDVIPEAEMDEAVATLKNRVLKYMSPKMTKALLLPYIYLVTNYSAWDMAGMCGFGNKMDGMDHWIVSVKWHFDFMGMGIIVSDKVFGRDASIIMLTDVYLKARTKGVLSVPKEFLDGVDRVTPLAPHNQSDEDTPEMKADPNYYLTRGFIDMPGAIILTDVFGYGKPYDVNSIGDEVKNYMLNAMLLSKEQLEEKYPVELYPLIHQRLDAIYKMFDAAGLDLRGGIQ